MIRTSKSFSILQATAAIVALTILLWSAGLPSLQFVEAANVTTLSDTLTDSGPGVVSDHTISFVTPTGVANGETITIDFSDGPFVVGSVDETDVDVLDDTNDLVIAADCSGSDEASAVFSGTTLTITLCAGDGAFIPSNGTTTIKIGSNATYGGDTGDADAQLTNPSAGSYEINVTAGSADTGSTRVAIVSAVTVTASVDTLFTFTVAGVAGGQTVNTADVTDGPTTATTIPFGELVADTASTTAQDLTVVTNAYNGFVVTVVSDGQLVSTNGADIDSFRNGNDQSTPVDWEAPTPVLGDEDTYGHWGLTSDDDALAGAADPFDAGGAGGRYAAASTTPVEVFRHTGPTDGTVTGEGTTRVGYKIEVTALQEAADDYTATLTYVATPVF
ncbi:hypothetical protein H6781_01265 [Candidatus Nomurabacteria bacterium]|nr:hypothetical protein [Candidatus Kaiserbacteria bacterium]MCB9810211.1 hypothetical protein [Candidatus Nomurabacteria bacterium]MCB9818141.1 hypothetical protein [Candidatus Nomurabacteria bacterium]